MTAAAQNYQWAFGTRIGGDMAGITAKYTLNQQSSVEALFAIPYDNGFNFLGMYERNYPLAGRSFFFYYGFGGHVGSWQYNRDKTKFVLGVDGVIGLEYGFNNIPLALSLDYKPTLNIIGHSGFHWESVGLGIKIIF